MLQWSRLELYVVTVGEGDGRTGGVNRVTFNGNAGSVGLALPTQAVSSRDTTQHREVGKILQLYIEFAALYTTNNVYYKRLIQSHYRLAAKHVISHAKAPPTGYVARSLIKGKGFIRALTVPSFRQTYF